MIAGRAELRLAEDSDDAEAMTALGVDWRRLPTKDRSAPSHADLDEAIVWLESRATSVGLRRAGPR